MGHLEMKKYTTRIMLVACLAFGTLGVMNTASAAETQPRMEKAIELLNKAKDDPTPLPLLEKAKEHLQNAPANKGGDRVGAIKLINEAIDVAQKGGKPTVKINKAIQLIESGIEHAR